MKDCFTVKELQKWLQQEIADVAKETELRLREASSIVVDYTAGNIDQVEATALFYQYNHRWMPAMNGVNAFDGVPNKELLERVNEAAKMDEYILQRGTKAKRESLLGRTGGKSGNPNKGRFR